MVTTSYDSAGRLNVITGQKLNEPDKAYASQFSYAAHGAVVGVKLGNELWEYALFNGRMQPYESGLGAFGGSSSLFKLEYEYVKNGFPATTNSCYHVTSRGNERHDIYRGEMDRLKFLAFSPLRSWRFKPRRI